MAISSDNGKVKSHSSPTEYEYTADELHEMGEILLKAKDIQSDKKLYKMVMDHMNMKVDKIRSLDDLRRKQKEVEMRDNEMDEYGED